MSAAADLLAQAPQSTAQAIARVLRASKNTAQQALVTRALNAVADAVPRMDTRAAGDAAGEASSYGVLLRLLEQPEVLAALRVESPLAPALVRGLQGREELLQAEGGTITASEAARLLHVTRQSVDNRRRGNRLIGLSLGRRGYAYPVWQFAESGTLTGLEDVLGDLKHFGPWMQAHFMTTGDRRLDGVTPLHALRDGRIQDVRRAARAFGEHGAG
ncbi:MAG TPA: hypothetical protein VIU62_23705 [Chloroflexota bacterium]